MASKTKTNTPPPGLDLDSLLDGANTSSKSKKGPDVPVMEVTDPKVQERMATWAQANKDIDTAAAVKASCESDLVPLARSFHQTTVDHIKKVMPAIKLNSPAVNMTVLVAKNQYTKIETSTEEQLTGIFGKDNFAKCFVKETSIELTEAALADKEILTLLIKAVGAENFQKYFDVKRVYKPTDALHQGRFLDPEIKLRADKAIEAGLLTPYKASFSSKA